MVGFGGVFSTLARFQWGRSLLLRYPGVFSNGTFTREGPTQQQMDSSAFRMTLVGTGFKEAAEANSGEQKPNRRVVVEVSGPEPGYVATPAIFLAVAQCLLEERSSLPHGGVFTPGAVFHQSSLVDRLKLAGLSFEVVSDEAK